MSSVFSKIKDLDGDGIPNAWEKAHKLNPQNAKDGNISSIGSGYTNLEVYLNELPMVKPL